jgi:hypothetical protein
MGQTVFADIIQSAATTGLDGPQTGGGLCSYSDARGSRDIYVIEAEGGGFRQLHGPHLWWIRNPELVGGWKVGSTFQFRPQMVKKRIGKVPSYWAARQFRSEISAKVLPLSHPTG